MRVVNRGIDVCFFVFFPFSLFPSYFGLVRRAQLPVSCFREGLPVTSSYSSSDLKMVRQ